MVDTIPEGIVRQDSKQSASPPVQDKYKSLLEEKERYQRRNWMSDEEVGEITFKLERSPFLDATCARVLDRIKNETEFFREFEEKELSYEVQAAKPIEEFKGTPVIWNAKEELGDDVLGAYEVNNDVIAVSGSPARKAEIIRELASYGMFPPTTTHFVHEVTHREHAHKGPAVRAWEYLRYLGKPQPFQHRELREVHAYRSGELPIHKASQEELIDHIKRNYPDADPEKLEYSVHAIDLMHALGYHARQTAKYAMNPESWDPKRKVYPRLQDSLEYVVKDEKLSPEDIEETVKIYKLTLEVESLKIQAIAQDELIKYKEAA